MKKKLILLLLTICAFHTVMAQRYPVQATLTLNAPHPVRLSEYTQIGSSKVQANIWLKDVSQQDIPVRFKLKIENKQKRFTLETKTSYIPEPLHLIGGQSELFDATVLGSYFELNNLSGPTSSIINNGGKLPDGAYTFSLEVLEYYTGRKISNTATFQCFIVLSDPPLLIMPYDEQKVQASDPQFINFSWNPRHLTSRNRPQNVTYRFQVVEILRQNQTAGDAFSNTRPIIDEEGVLTPSYQVTMIDTPLEPGNKYAWRVQAYDEDNLGLLKNDGWSEPRLFQFGDACRVCEQFAIANTTPSRIEVEWQGDFSHNNWEVRYRRKVEEGEDILDWNTKEFIADLGQVKPLTPGVEYELQVRGVCLGERFGEWSEIISASTEEQPEQNYKCEGGEFIISWENSDPYSESLKVGEKFTAGDFDVTVVEDNFKDGKHSGNGMIRIAAFNKVFFTVEYDDIVINTDYQLIEGEAYVTGSDTDIIDPELAAAIMDGLDQLDAVLAEAEATAEFIENVFDNLPEEIKNEITNSKENVEAAKDELDTAKDILKEAKNSGNEEAIAAAKQSVENAKQSKSTAKTSKKQAINAALNYIKEEIKKSIKLFVQFANGINRTLQIPKGPGRATEAKRTVEVGDELLAKLELLDGIASLSPSDEAKEAAIQEQDAALADLVKFMGNIIATIQGNAPLDSSGDELMTLEEKWQDAEGVLSRYEVKNIADVFEMTRTSIWAVKMLFETMYETTSNDEGEIQSGEGWHSEDRLLFTKLDATPYGFDIGGRSFDKAYYTEVDLSSHGDAKNYTLPWVVANATNSVKIGFTGVTEGVLFKSNKGELTASASNGEVSLSAHKSKKSTEWIAYKMVEDEEKIVGKINVQSYEPKTDYKLYIYAVNGQSLPDASTIQTYLNNIYGQALINWTVEVKSDLAYTTWDTETVDEKIQVSGSDELKAYTEEQKNIINYFRDNHPKPKGNEFVLFWSPEASESGVKGFMPLSKRYGFIFEPEKQADLNRTVAHELGHGAFALRHTWDVFESITKGASKNLMDYDGGLELWKWQWDLIQNPAPMVGFENEDEEGMAFGEIGTTIALINCEDDVEASLADKVYYLPDGKTVVDLSNYKLDKVAFYSVNDVTEAARGALAGFKIGKKLYQIVVNEENIISFKSTIDEIHVSSIISTETSVNSKAKRVYVSCTENSIQVEGAESFTSDCITCTSNTIDWELPCAENLVNYKGHEFLKEGNFFEPIIKKNPCLLNNLQDFHEIPPGLVKEGNYYQIKEEYLLLTTTDDKENYWDDFVQKAGEKLTAMLESPSGFDNFENQQVYSDFVTVKNSHLPADWAATEKLLEDKLRAYYIEYNSIQESPRSAYILGLDLPFFVSSDELEQLQKEILEETSFDENRQSVLFDFVYVSTKIKEGSLPEDDLIHLSGVQGFGSENITLPNTNIKENSYRFYTYLPKTYQRFTYFININGELIEYITEKLYDVTGSFMMNELTIFYDKNIKVKTDYWQVQRKLSEDESTAGYESSNSALHSSNQHYFTNVYLPAFEKYNTLLESQTTKGYKPIRQLVAHNVAESYIPSLGKKYAEYFFVKELYRDFKEDIVEEYQLYDSYEIPFYAKKDASDDEIKRILETFSLIVSPIPYADTFFDLFLLGYCVARPELGCKLEASINLTLPAAITGIKVAGKAMGTSVAMAGLKAFLFKPKGIEKAVRLVSKKLTKEQTEAFLKDLSSSRHVTGSLLKENINNIDEELIDVWLVMYKHDPNAYKRIDYDFLLRNKTNPAKDIIADYNATKSTDDLFVKLMDQSNVLYCEPCADVIKNRSTIRSNTKNQLSGKELTNFISALEKGEYGKYTKTEMLALLDGKDPFNIFEAHHIFPVNLFRNPAFNKYFKHKGSKAFSFNAKDNALNSIFIEKYRKNSLDEYSGAHTSHKDYEDEIAEHLDDRWLEISKLIKKDNQNLSEIEIEKLVANELHSEIESLARNLKSALLEHSVKVKDPVNVNNLFKEIDFEDLINID